MLIADVNILVYAFRQDSPRHARYKAWLQEKLAGPEPVGLSELVLSGFIRVVTNHRVFVEPTAPEVAFRFCEAALAAPSAIPVRPGVKHWSVFARLCQTVRARGNVVPDAYHAALAIDHDATWVTTDRGFARFPGLRWALPLEGAD